MEKGTIIVESIDQSANTVIYTIKINEVQEKIEYYVNDICVPLLTLDRIDNLVVGLLPLLTEQGYNLESSIPMTRDLWYNITNYLIPGIAIGKRNIHRPIISCPLIEAVDVKEKIYNLTGISCGVDSLYTIAQDTTSDIPDEDKINGLCFFNIGAAYKGGDIRTELVDGRKDNAEKFAKEYGYPLFFIESNLPLLYEKNGGYSHTNIHTYMFLSIVHLLQKGIKKYHYSSGYSLLDFDIKASNSDKYEFFIFYLLSNTGMTIYNDGAEVSRLDKVKKLVTWEPSYRYLNVCVDDANNCGVCFKCIRTLLEIDAVGNINKYKEVFDVDFYKRNRNVYLRRLYIDGGWKNNLYMKELLPYYNHELTTLFKLKCILSVIINKIIKKREII